MAKSKPPEHAGRYAYEGLERVLHEKARLGLLASLAAHPDGLSFNELKELCTLTDGNLSRHLKVLEEAGLLEVQKSFEQNRPLTLCRMTPEGRRRFLDYVDVLEQVVRDAAAAAKEAVSKRPATAAKPGWSPA
jgi:DNA-binding transcriptional ArsR family regulator